MRNAGWGRLEVGGLVGVLVGCSGANISRSRGSSVMLEGGAGSGVVGTKFISGSSTQRGVPRSFNKLGEPRGFGYSTGGDNLSKILNLPRRGDSTDSPRGSTVPRVGDILLAAVGLNCREGEKAVRSTHFGDAGDVGGGESGLGFGADIPTRAGGEGNAVCGGDVSFEEPGCGSAHKGEGDHSLGGVPIPLEPGEFRGEDADGALPSRDRGDKLRGRGGDCG